MSHDMRLALAIALSSTAITPVAGWAQEAPASPEAAQPSQPVVTDTGAPDSARGPVDTQAAAPTPPQGADDIIVTARRRDERLLDTPVAITAISGGKLASYQIATVSDLGTQVPSLIAGKASSGSSASIFLRGVGSTALSAGFDQSVSFVFDGLPLSRGRDISLPQFDIQRVEVLKGPQALFFGKNTTGGLISITSNSPTDHFEAGIKGGYGFEARQKYVEAYISGPLSDTLKARIAGRYSDSEGAFINTAADTYPNYVPDQFRFRNSKRRGGAETIGVRATLDWQPSDWLKFELKGGYSNVQDGGPTDIIERICGGGRTVVSDALTPFGNLPPSPNADCKVNGRSDQSGIPVQVANTNYRWARDGRLYGDFTSEYGVLTGTVTSDPFDVTSITGFYHFKQYDLNNVSGEAYPAGFSELSDFEQVSQELRFQSKFDGPFNILTGFFYAHGDMTFDTDAYIFPLPLDPVNNTYVTFKRDDGFTSDSTSVFAQGTLTFGKLELSGGARYSIEDRDSFQQSLPAHSAFAAAFPGNVRIDDRYRDDNISPEATIRFKPTRDSMIYVAYKQGFKSGGFNISQSIIPGASDATGRFGAETAEGFETGLRTLLFNRMLSFNLTAYDFKYKDLQVQFFDPVTTGEVAGNAGELRTKGVEGEATLRIPGVQGLSLRGAAAYNDARFHDYQGQCYPGQTIAEGCDLGLANGAYTLQDYENRVAPKAPHFSGRVGGTLDLPIASSGWRAVANADYSYTSRYNFSDALRPDSIQKAYGKIDASLSIQGPDERWSLSVIGRNLTNKLVVTTSNDIPFTGGIGTGTATGLVSDINAYVENPREVFVELGFKF